MVVMSIGTATQILRRRQATVTVKKMTHLEYEYSLKKSLHKELNTLLDRLDDIHLFLMLGDAGVDVDEGGVDGGNDESCQ